jgi:AraC-like DNA-binding protein
VHYREITPPLFLTRFVECCWTLEGEPTAGRRIPERILPDGCVEIILNFSDAFTHIHDSGKEEMQPRNLLVGQMTRPVLIAPTGTTQLIGIRFHPGGTFPFFRVPMQDTTDRVVELRAVSSDLERELLVAAEAAPGLEAKVIAVLGVLERRVRNSKHDSWLIDLTASMVKAAGIVSLDRLAFDAGIGSRQLRRRFQVEVGIGPKLLCRLLRFQQVFKAVDRNEPEWTTVALECGYYDQAHLINDFRQFAHQTPSVLFANPSSMTEAFTRKNR